MRASLAVLGHGELEKFVEAGAQRVARFSSLP
jgi:hypothetical protein